jgi:hypothetical protein
MKPFTRRLLQAYRPLYLRGQLMDGQYRPPSADTCTGSTQPSSRKRMLLVALFGQLQNHSSPRSKS